MSSGHNRPAFFAASALLLSALCTLSTAKIIYVDDDATGANNGTSWTDAYTFLQEALADADQAEKPVEIRVAQGIYRPDQGLVAIPEFDWRTATFQLINGITLKGGYAGVTEGDANARDISGYETILSGDIGGDDASIPDANSLLNDATRQENCYHVVTASNIGASAVLDGLTISGGNANGEQEEETLGGGLYCLDSHLEILCCVFRINASVYGGAIFNDVSGALTVRNCRFIRNNAGMLGGAIDNTARYSVLIMERCTFTENHAFSSGGAIMTGSNDPMFTNCIFERNSSARGGGIYNYKAGNPTLVDCVFIDNSVEHFGGGMYNNSGESGQFLVRCTFKGNFAGWYGGGFYNSYNGKPTIENSVFMSNSSGHWGGAIHFWRSTGEIRNCTVVSNSAQRGGALGCGFEDEIMPSNIKITNCILWDNGEEIYNDDNSQIMISHSCVADMMPGRLRLPNGNINADPCFAEHVHWNVTGVCVDGDYHLKSETGRWDPVNINWVRDVVTSPCIDAGDPNSDLGDEVWPHGGLINMGAYGGTREASMSVEPQSMSLPYILYIHDHDIETAESFRSLLAGYGCPTTLIDLGEVGATVLDFYDLIVVGNDTGFTDSWGDAESVAAVDASGIPVIGLGEGGYAFFGWLGLSIGWPNGMHGSRNSILVIDPDSSHFNMPYPIDVPEDRALQLYTQADRVGLHLWPVPETVTVLGGEVGNPGYYPLALEHDRYLLWGFDASAENMTEAGKYLFINVVIRTANAVWATESN